jgi:hypothetical protein
VLLAAASCVCLRGVMFWFSKGCYEGCESERAGHKSEMSVCKQGAEGCMFGLLGWLCTGFALLCASCVACWVGSARVLLHCAHLVFLRVLRLLFCPSVVHSCGSFRVVC